MQKYELVIIRIDQLKEVEDQPWQVHAEGYIKEEDEEGIDLTDFNWCNWYTSEDYADQEADLIADCLLKTNQTAKVTILKSGNEIETRRKLCT